MKMAIASLWVLPVAIIIVVSTAKVQQKLTQKSMDAKMDAANGIQECIDTIADLKSNNAEKRYLASLDDKIDNVEKRALKGEFGTVRFCFLRTNGTQVGHCDNGACRLGTSY